MGRRIAAIAATAIAVAILAVGAPAIAGGAQPLRVTVGTLGAIGSLDPRHGDSAVAHEVWNLQYPTLTAVDPKTLDPAPGVASGWVPAKHGNGWVYTVRKGLMWSDGKPVTAADVVYSLEHARDEHWPYAGNSLVGLRARAIGERTVEVTYPAGTKAPPDALAARRARSTCSRARTTSASDAAKLGVADGMWHVVSAGRRYRAARRGRRGERAGGRSRSSSAPIRTPNALIDALAAKQVDVVSGVPAADVARLEDLQGVTVNHSSDGTRYVLRFVAFPVGLLHAVSQAIDRTALVADAVHGVGTPVQIATASGPTNTELRALEADGRPEPTIAIPDDTTGRRVGELVAR